MLLSEFFIIEDIYKSHNSVGFDHGMSSGMIYFKGNRILKIDAPKGKENKNITGSLIYLVEPDLFDFFVIMSDNKMYPLPDKKYHIDILRYIVKNRETVARFKSFKLLINFIKF